MKEGTNLVTQEESLQAKLQTLEGSIFRTYDTLGSIREEPQPPGISDNPSPEVTGALSTLDRCLKAMAQVEACAQRLRDVIGTL